MNYETNDLALAAYLLIRGFALKDAFVSKSGIYVFRFNDVNGKIPQVAIEFINSDCARFDAQIKNLKKILRNKP
ncbi:MAG TPA: hypothetical protein DCQ49_13585 [Methylophaga sp.]|nr:hypothetical protein [Methylophaga sp.]